MKNEMGHPASSTDAPPPLTSGEIEELERLLEKATPGPWKAQDNGVFFTADGWRALLASCSTERDNWRNDAAFIAAMRNALPRLLSSLKQVPPSTAGWLPMASALRKAAKQFRFYEAEHLKKADGATWNGTYAMAQTAIDKAATNRQFAEMCEAALPPAPSQEGASEGEGSPANRGPV